MNKDILRKQGGFTLIEAFLVLALAAVLSGIAAWAMSEEQDAKVRDEIVRQFTQDLKTLNAGVRNYILNEDLSAFGNTWNFHAQTLVNQGYLPENFGNLRLSSGDTNATRSPLGGFWWVYFRKGPYSGETTPGVNTDTVRAVITIRPSDMPNPGVAERLKWDDYIVSSQSLGREIVSEGADIDNLYAGYVMNSSTTFTGASGFQRVLSNWGVGTNNSYSRPAALVGFTELESDGLLTQPPCGPGDASPQCFGENYASCRVVPPRNIESPGGTAWQTGGTGPAYGVRHAAGACASTEDEVATWSGCGTNPAIMVLPWGSTYSVGYENIGDLDPTDGVTSYNRMATVALEGIPQATYQCQRYESDRFDYSCGPFGCQTDIRMYQWETAGSWCCIRK